MKECVDCSVLDDFARFLVVGKINVVPLFDRIKFNINEFCGDRYYYWDFKDAQSAREKIDNKFGGECKVDEKLMCFICEIYNNKKLNCAEKIIAFRLGISNSLSLSDVDEINLSCFMINTWGGINTGAKNVKKCAEVVREVRKEGEDEVYGLLIEKIGNLKLVPSWSKVLSAIDCSKYYVYDSRISLVLRFLWSAYLKSENKRIQNPFVFKAGKDDYKKVKASQGRFATTCLPNVECLGNQIDNDGNGCNDKIREKSYRSYCYLINKIADLLIEERDFSIGLNCDLIRQVAILSLNADINKLITCQMIEMAFFGLIGRDGAKVQKKTDYYFLRAGDKIKESIETPGFNIDNMKQLKVLLGLI